MKIIYVIDGQYHENQLFATESKEDALMLSAKIHGEVAEDYIQEIPFIEENPAWPNVFHPLTTSIEDKCGNSGDNDE
jgi:hypothetical protein